jgi:predicted glycosyltransferase
MILEAVQHFKPHLLLVDKAAAGVHGELRPALRDVKTWLPETQLVLGMRDIEDSPQATRVEWAHQNIHHLLDHIYDRILLYGQRDLFDPVQAYGMSRKAASKLFCCGYLRRGAGRRSSEEVRRELGVSDRPLVVVTVGGGGDGFAVIKAFLAAMACSARPWDALVITGPLMAQSKQAYLQRSATQVGVPLMAFTPDLPSYLAAADLVVSMAGYNTVCEILTLGKRALLIPRIKVRAEQQLRAEALARRRLAHVLLPRDLNPGRLARAIDKALKAPPPVVSLELDGLQRASAAIRTLLQEAPSHVTAVQYGVKRFLLDQKGSLGSGLLLPAVTSSQVVHGHDQ